jgi:predicted restriction endonuclease
MIGFHPSLINDRKILCLSPNMHVLFDLGALTLSDDLQVIGKCVQLLINPQTHVKINLFPASQLLYGIDV